MFVMKLYSIMFVHIIPLIVVIALSYTHTPLAISLSSIVEKLVSVIILIQSTKDRPSKVVTLYQNRATKHYI